VSNTTQSEIEEIARISRESQSVAQDRRFLRLSKMRKGEAIVVKLVGGYGKVVRPTFGDTTKEQGDDAFFQYEFELLQGVGEIVVEPALFIWDAPKVYFKRLDPLMRMGHCVFKITRTHTKGEKDQQGNIMNVANYEILSVDQANPSLVIA
jgi:hypothetical protein